jgi:hypothetical protein
MKQHGRSALLKGLFLACLIATTISFVSLTALPVDSGQSTSLTGLPAPAYPGYPGDTALMAMGDALVPKIESSQQFKSLANDESYHVEPDSSFGYSWGASIASTIRVILYSPNQSSYIVSDVFQNNDTIMDMYFVNSTQVGDYLTSGNDGYGGYSAQYCSHAIFGICLSDAAVGEAYGRIQVPNTISAPPSGEDSSCCKFAEWTGVANGTDGDQFLTQGGIAWSGFHDIGPSSENNENMSLVVEYNSPSGPPPTWISPPVWMHGVVGERITMETLITSSCSLPNGARGDLWSEIWSLGSSYTSQVIHCMNAGTMNYAWYVFESPGAILSCGSGYYDYPYHRCQIPDFSFNGEGLLFTGNICNNKSSCENVNVDSNPIKGYYIDQAIPDTITGPISRGGASWNETWVPAPQ